jgi:hypothetical protein
MNLRRPPDVVAEDAAAVASCFAPDHPNPTDALLDLR